MHHPRRRIRKWKTNQQSRGRIGPTSGRLQLIKTIVAIIEEKCNIAIYKIPIDTCVKSVLSVFQTCICYLGHPFGKEAGDESPRGLFLSVR